PPTRRPSDPAGGFRDRGRLSRGRSRRGLPAPAAWRGLVPRSRCGAGAGDLDEHPADPAGRSHRAVGARRAEGCGGEGDGGGAGQPALSGEHPPAAPAGLTASRPAVGLAADAMIVSDGLCDLQVNGFAGVDFNDAGLTAQGLDIALAAMRATGVTTCLPTLITAHEAELAARLAALDRAVTASRLGPAMVPGYHIEGPFLNPADGFRGCHPAEAMGDPDAGLYARLAREASRPILLVTLAPEREGAIAAIAALRAAGIAVAMAHSNAGLAEVRRAADAGLTLSTHLGNGLPQQLHKTENPPLA